MNDSFDGKSVAQSPKSPPLAGRYQENKLHIARKAAENLLQLMNDDQKDDVDCVIIGDASLRPERSTASAVTVIIFPKEKKVRIIGQKFTNPSNNISEYEIKALEKGIEIVGDKLATTEIITDSSNAFAWLEKTKNITAWHPTDFLEEDYQPGTRIRSAHYRLHGDFVDMAAGFLTGSKQAKDFDYTVSEGELQSIVSKYTTRNALADGQKPGGYQRQ